MRRMVRKREIVSRTLELGSAPGGERPPLSVRTIGLASDRGDLSQSWGDHTGRPPWGQGSSWAWSLAYGRRAVADGV